MKKRFNSLFWVFLCSIFLFTLAALTGCGGSSNPTTTSSAVTSFTENTYDVYGSTAGGKLKYSGTTPTVVVLPDGVTPPAGYTSITATITSNSDGTTVTTDANGKFDSNKAVGTDAKNAASTDASQQPDVTVNANVGGTQVTGTATISIASSAKDTDVPVGLKVIPHEFKAPVSGTFFFQALRTNADGKVIKATNVTWSAASCPAGTTITAQKDTAFAVLTAGATAGTGCQITASILDNNKNATATDTATGAIVSDSDAVTVAAMAHDTTGAAWPKAAVNLDCFAGTYTAAAPPPPDVRPAHFVAIADAAGNATIKVYAKNSTCRVSLGVPNPQPAPANNIYCSVTGTAAAAGADTCPPGSIIAIGTANITTTQHIYAKSALVFKPLPPIERYIRMSWNQTNEAREYKDYDPLSLNNLMDGIMDPSFGTALTTTGTTRDGWSFTLNRTFDSSNKLLTFTGTKVDPKKVVKKIISCDLTKTQPTCTFQLYQAAFTTSTTAPDVTATTAILVREGTITATYDSTAVGRNGNKLFNKTVTLVKEYFMDTPGKVAMQKQVTITVTFNAYLDAAGKTQYHPSTSTTSINRYGGVDTALATVTGSFNFTRVFGQGDFNPTATTVTKVLTFSATSAEDKAIAPDGTAVSIKDTFDGSYVNSDFTGVFTFTDTTTDGPEVKWAGSQIVVNLVKPDFTTTPLYVAKGCTVKVKDDTGNLQLVATYSVDMQGNITITKNDGSTQQMHM